jgi:hypothetical protein
LRAMLRRLIFVELGGVANPATPDVVYTLEKQLS